MPIGMKSKNSLAPVFLLMHVTLVRSLDECCTEHHNLRLGGRDANYGPDKDWDLYLPATYDGCMQSCLDKPNCVASMFDSFSTKCYEYYQTPRQRTELANNYYTSFLCRTRAMQDCSYNPGWRLHGDGDSNSWRKYGGISTDKDCLDKCEEQHKGQYYGTLKDGPHPDCFCYLVIPGISHGSSRNSYLCSNRVVSCKAKNAKKNGSPKICERFNKLRLYRSYNDGDVYTLHLIEHTNKSEEECKQVCLSKSECVATTYETDTETCQEFTGNVPGQYPGPSNGFVSFLCE